ncbi:DUF2059 domain-containing protein [Acinetobacter sp. WCHAc060033]|uniref:DUF2059 domain-containing protein n=1 Tax=Acinetobacter sp. WCHAc060033 TaxID=2518624 RepID=UPI001022E5CF|nr:DUF2059 domain-containing protein [Acinetobacter sp. WCHAc060033]RZG86373.1 DUF2059 domain-containing protein [Acinetobacter sp. WCHAc060033]
MKLFPQLLLISSCLTANLTFAAPASDQQIQQLLNVMNLDTLLQETIQKIRPQLDQQAYQIVKMTVKKDQLNPQEQIVANELSDKLYAQSQKTVSWDQMKPLYQKIYKEVYSAEEIQAQIDFYSSTVGQSILKKTPQVAQETMALMNTKLMSSMQTTAADFKEINKKLDTLKKAAENK